MRKLKRLNIRKIVKHNLGVNATKFGEAMKDLDGLRRSGVRPKEYSLPMPFSKGLHVSHSPGSDDPRMVYLGRP